MNGEVGYAKYTRKFLDLPFTGWRIPGLGIQGYSLCTRGVLSSACKSAWEPCTQNVFPSRIAHAAFSIRINPEILGP